MITKDMIIKGIEKGVVKFDTSDEGVEGCGIICKIGDNWFYFAGIDAETMTKDEYLAGTTSESLAGEILGAIKELGDGERGYYEAVLNEAGCSAETRSNLGKDDDILVQFAMLWGLEIGSASNDREWLIADQMRKYDSCELASILDAWRTEYLSDENLVDDTVDFFDRKLDELLGKDAT